jgi:hypothetical protein
LDKINIIFPVPGEAEIIIHYCNYKGMRQKRWAPSTPIFLRMMSPFSVRRTIHKVNPTRPKCSKTGTSTESGRKSMEKTDEIAYMHSPHKCSISQSTDA